MAEAPTALWGSNGDLSRGLSERLAVYLLCLGRPARFSSPPLNEVLSVREVAQVPGYSARHITSTSSVFSTFSHLVPESSQFVLHLPH